MACLAGLAESAQSNDDLDLEMLDGDAIYREPSFQYGEIHCLARLK